MAAFTGAVYAQPTFNAANLNPVPTEIFIGHQIDTTGIVPGAPGGTMTWNFATVTELALDTTTYLNCTATPYCDSFPGATIASYDNTNYIYAVANTSRFTFIGGHVGTQFVHFAGYNDALIYPENYLDAHRDTFSFSLTFMGFPILHTEIDSFVYDAYGTLTLPSGTYTNVMRIHRYEWTTDSVTGFGSSTGLIEQYEWFASGFHNPLFTYDVDTSGGNSAEYYTQNAALGVPQISAAGSLTVFPNPANEVINVRFNAPAGATLTLTDITGRTVAGSDNAALHAGDNSVAIPVAGLPSGLYLVQLHSGEGTVTKKVTIAH